MAYMAMACIGTAYLIMAVSSAPYITRAHTLSEPDCPLAQGNLFHHCSHHGSGVSKLIAHLLQRTCYGPYTYCSYGPFILGQYNYGMHSYGLCSNGLYVMACRTMAYTVMIYAVTACTVMAYTNIASSRPI